jgi:hypothetical protein
MFKIGDSVSWQKRNKFAYRESNFYIYTGHIIFVSIDQIDASYIDSRTQSKQIQSFRLLRNGQWIAKQEKQDDPKGRLYLEHYTEELEAAE